MRTDNIANDLQGSVTATVTRSFKLEGIRATANGGRPACRHGKSRVVPWTEIKKTGQVPA